MIKDKNNLKIVKKQIAKVANQSLEVGYFAGVNYADGQSVASVAGFQEFGTSKIPKRATLAPSFDKMVGSNRYRFSLLNKDNPWQFLGAEMVNRLKSEIVSFSSPANRPNTVRIKGRDNPLIHTGLMLNSVRFRIK